MEKVNIFLIILFLFHPLQTFTQLEISGYIYEINENRKLTGAKIQLEGTLLGSISDKEGKFKISKIPKGEYSIIISFTGYETFKQKIILQSDTTLNFGLKIKEITKPEIVVSAARRLQFFDDVPVSMSIVDNNFLQRKNYVETKDYLNFVSGVQVNSDNISIRGSSGYQFGSGSRVALLIDGFPFLSGDIGDANINLVSPRTISQIEILKGSGSALYGNSAMGGVINIVTKEPEERFSLYSEIVSGIYTQPKYQEWIYTDKLRTKNSFATTLLSSNSFGKFLFNGQFINDESYRKFNKSNNISLYGKFVKPFNNGRKLNLFAFYNYKYSDDGTFWQGAYHATTPPEDYDLSRKIKKDRIAVGLDFVSNIGKYSYFTLKSSIFRTNFESNLPKTDQNYRQSTSLSNFNEFQINHHLLQNSIVTSGFTLINNWVKSFQYGNRKQSIFSLFTQGEFALFEYLNTTGGIRLDYDISDSSRKYFEFSPRFGINYNLNDKISVKTSLGKGFRVATISERFSSIRHSGFTIEPNPNLSPEKSWNFELGTRIESHIIKKIFYFDATIFLSRYKNLIEPQFDTNAATPTIRFQNISNSEIKGFDITMQTQPWKDLEWFLNLTFLDPKDLNKNEILKFRSKLYFTSGLTFYKGGLFFSLLYKYVSKIVKVEDQLRFILNDYEVRVPIHLLDFNVGYNLNKFKLPFEITLTIQNLLDYYYVDLVGNLAPTRFISLGVKYSITK